MTKEKYNLKEDIKPSKISSAYIGAPFDVGKTELERNGYRIISLEESANLRMENPFSEIENGFWVREGMLYVPNKGVYITKNSPIMDFPEEATQAHREGKDFYLTNEQVKHALEDSIQLPPHDIKIPTNSFRDNVLAFYLFGKYAVLYGDHLEYEVTDEKKDPINKIFVNVDGKSFRKTELPFVRQIFFRDIAYASDVDGNGRGFDNGPLALHGISESEDNYYFGVRGIKEVE